VPPQSQLRRGLGRIGAVIHRFGQGADIGQGQHLDRVIANPANHPVNKACGGPLDTCHSNILKSGHFRAKGANAWIWGADTANLMKILTI
jgi:hypothetical protein